MRTIKQVQKCINIYIKLVILIYEILLDILNVYFK